MRVRRCSNPAGPRMLIRSPRDGVSKSGFNLGHPASINARFLCDATGRSRFLARRLRLGIRSDGRLLALIAYWKQDVVLSCLTAQYFGGINSRRLVLHRRLGR